MHHHLSFISQHTNFSSRLQACGAIVIVLAVVELFVVCVYRGSISLAIKVIEEAARAFEALPGLLLIPFIQLALYAVGIFWFIFSFVYLASSGTFDAELGSFQISQTLRYDWCSPLPSAFALTLPPAGTSSFSKLSFLFGLTCLCMRAASCPYQGQCPNGISQWTRQAAVAQCLLLSNERFAFTLVPQHAAPSLCRLLRCCAA